MDMAALHVMEFKNTQWADKKAGFNPKEELDKAHFEKMVEITMKWKMLAEGQPNLDYSKVWFINLKICIWSQVDRALTRFVMRIKL